MKKLTLKLLVGAFVLTCFISKVSAADMISPFESHSGESNSGWKSGPYIGGHVGYGTGNLENTNNGADEDLDGGFVGGIHGGFNIVNGGFLYGIEGDISSLGADYTESGCVLGICDQLDVDFNYLASIRGRIGAVVSDKTLLYVTGGIAWTEAEVDYAITDGITTFTDSEEYSETGFVVGGGAEMKIMENMTVRAEVLHYGFEFEDTNTDANFIAARAGITWLLN